MNPNSCVSNNTNLTPQKIIEAFDKIASENTLENNIKNDVDLIELQEIDPNITRTNKDLLEKEINEHEYFSVLSQLKKSKAAGPDFFTAEILWKIPRELHLVIFNCFSFIFVNHSIPKSWYQYNTIFIPKSDGINARPISINSIFLKLFEKHYIRD